MRQPSLNVASQNNNYYSQNPVSTDSYQPTICEMKSRYPITYNNMKIQRVNLQFFHKCQMPQNQFK